MTNRPDADRLERAARNQSMFREVNERLQDLASGSQTVAGTAVFACECADLKCGEQIEITIDEYEAVRRDPNQFIVLPGHVYHDVEDVLQDNERYVVVAKIGEGAKLAAAQDPRS